MRAMWVRLCAIVAVIGILTTGCETITRPILDNTIGAVMGDVNPPGAKVFRGLEQTLNRPGFIYHVTIKTELVTGPFSHTGTIQRWVDAEHDVAREEVSISLANSTTQETATVIANGKDYRREFSGEVSAWKPGGCYGVSAAISLVLGCPDFTVQWTTVEAGQYAGKPSIVLVTNSATPGDERLTVTGRLHLEPDTYLPIALERDGTNKYAETIQDRGNWIFTNEFIPADSVANDLFDPVSIGYVERDPAGQLRQTSWGIPVYWLGQHVDGTGELPPLILGLVEVPIYHGPGYKFNLNYHSDNGPSGPPVVAIEGWSTMDWKANDAARRSKRPPRWDSPCWEREELELLGGRATIYSGFASEPSPGRTPDVASSEITCPDQPHDQFIALVELGPTFLFIEASSESGLSKSPFNSHEGMEAIVRALRPLSAS